MNSSIICRTCTKKFVLSNNLFPIYSNCSLIDEEPPIKIIENYFNENFQINQNDEMPQQICSSCLQQFISIKEFLDQCKMSQNQLEKKFVVIHTKVNNVKKTLRTEEVFKIIPKQECQTDKNEVEEQEFDYVEYLEDERMEPSEQNIKQENAALDIHNQIVESISENENLHVTTNILETVQDSDIYKETFLIENVDEETEETQILNNVQNIQTEENIDISHNEFYRIEGDSDNSSQNDKNYKELNDQNEIPFNSMKFHSKFKFKCLECYEKFFATQRALENHNRKFHSNIDWLLDHSSNSETNSTEKYECDICKQTFKLIISLEKHRLQRHINGRSKDNFVHKCLECGRVYPRSDHLQLHIRNKHLGLNPHVCEICGKSFPVRNQKNSHVKLKHSGIDTSVLCHLCNKTFSSTRYLKRHQAEIHSDKPEFKCVICEQEFFKKTDLTFHSKIHNENEIIHPENEHVGTLVKENKTRISVLAKKKLKNEMKYKIQEDVEVEIDNYMDVEGEEVQIT